MVPAAARHTEKNCWITKEQEIVLSSQAYTLSMGRFCYVFYLQKNAMKLHMAVQSTPKCQCILLSEVINIEIVI